MTPNQKLDLVLERTIDVPPELVWAAWTQPEHLKKWFCPRPWRVTECEIDLRPGGIFATAMAGPDGEQIPATPGCFLEVVPNRRLVFTSALQPGYRPAAGSGAPFHMTAIVSLEPHGEGGTKYTATALHSSEEAMKQHEEMGFHQGWGTALDQLVELCKTM